MSTSAAHRLRALAALALAAALLGGCAWTNRENRPVWNAFEEHLVPEGDTAFVAALPLTVPAGLVSILLDTVVVHPAQVIDDAAGDASDVWNGWRPGLEDSYYTQMASIPFRAVGTPIVFVLFFLARSTLDVPAYDPDRAWNTDRGGDDGAVRRPEPSEIDARRTQDLIKWLKELSSGSIVPRRLTPPDVWSEELLRQLDKTLETAPPRGLAELYMYAVGHDLPVEILNPLDGLRDPDPVVRYMLLERWRTAGWHVPSDLAKALRADPSEAIRRLAKRRGL